MAVMSEFRILVVINLEVMSGLEVNIIEQEIC